MRSWASRHLPVYSRRHAVLRACALAALALMQVGAARADLTAAGRKQVFLQVWSRVKETHFDARLNGVDWNAVRVRYAPKVAAKQPDGAFYALLNSMLGELKQSHFQLIPPDGYVAEDDVRGRDLGGETGMTVQLVEGLPVITRIAEGSPAAGAGVRNGLQLISVDDRRIDPLVARIRSRKMRPGVERTYVSLAARGLLSGPVGTTAHIVARDLAGKEWVYTVERAAPEGEVARLGELPPLHVRMVSRMLPGNVGYVSWNFFMIPLLEPIKEAIIGMKSARAIILDVRGNPGGVGVLAGSISSVLFKRQTSLGTMKMRAGELRFPVLPAPTTYDGPIYILTDEGSASTSEIMAGALQELHRARVVGRATPGMVLPSLFEKLPGGARLQYAFADCKTPAGVLLEGRGVTPDLPVNLTRRMLEETPDPILGAALKQATTP